MNLMKKIVEVVTLVKLIIIICLILEIVLAIIRLLEELPGMKFFKDYTNQKKKKLLMKK